MGLAETFTETLNTTKAVLHTANDKMATPARKAVTTATKKATAKVASTIEPATERLSSLPGADRLAHLHEPRAVLNQWATQAEKLVADGTRRGKDAVTTALAPVLPHSSQHSEPADALEAGDRPAGATDAVDADPTEAGTTGDGAEEPQA